MIDHRSLGMKPFDLHGLKTYELRDRPCKVFRNDLGKTIAASATVADLIDALPHQLAGLNIRKVRDHLVRCFRENRTVAIALGGHVIKTGCSPYLIDWVECGMVKSVSMNGSAAIHDFELACAGKTSEDVAAQLPDGQFGMARETADAFAIASQYGSRGDVGLGAALGRYIEETKCPHADISLVHACWRNNVPCTVHVALGTDIVHMHPHVSGASLGEASMIDFRKLCGVVANLAHGTWMNIGSAVIMPEVFLKAVSVVHNFGHDLDGMVTVNLDKESKYRTLMNVLSRPSNEGIEMVGPHEVQIPLLHAAVAAEMAKSGSQTWYHAA
jgi:hypothetical protein